MNKLTLVTLVVLASLSFSSTAHQDHGAEMFQSTNISREEAIVIATNKVSNKIESKDLESTWSSVKNKNAVLERVDGRQVWKISFSKDNETSNEVLNVYLSKTGDLISISK